MKPWTAKIKRGTFDSRTSFGNGLNRLASPKAGRNRLVIGFAAGSIPKVPINLALLNERSIVGVYWSESVKRDPESHLRNVKQLMEWFAAGKVNPSISEWVSLSEAAAAMKRLIRRQVKGKVVILPEA